MKRFAIIPIIAIAGFLSAQLASAQHAGMPPGMTHEEHLAQMKKEAETQRRGAEAMGFDQEKTAHHFNLTTDGGTIAVSTRDADDTTSRDQIRAHLKSIAEEFGRGEFGKPVATHAEVPPGVETMQRSKDQIRYIYDEMPRGGLVRIVTSDAAAIDAIHAFLRYQITEHKTGDPLSVQGVATRDH
jgi:hypothetical protein